MAHPAPVIYLVHGEDEFAIAQFLNDLVSKLGDAETAALNTTYLDGRTFNLSELLSIAGAMPFLAKRRLVILSHPTAKVSGKDAQEAFEQKLGQIPATTALVLAEYKDLTSDKDRRSGKLHWLEEWARKPESRTYLKHFRLPDGAQMQRWIRDQAQSWDGAFTPLAANALASLVGNDTRLAAQEIEKLLAFVNYKRAVDVDDVEALTADYAQGDIFDLVDAVASQQSRQAMSLLQRLLDQQDALLTFGMIQRQFRLLLQAREILDAGGNEAEVRKRLKLHPFVAKKTTLQVQRFNLKELEIVFRRLLDLDEAIKTGQITSDLALETLVAAFTNV